MCGKNSVSNISVTKVLNRFHDMLLDCSLSILIAHLSDLRCAKNGKFK